MVNGNLPVTASDGQDPTDTISPQGPASQDINFACCTGILAYDNPALERRLHRPRPAHADRSGLAVLRLHRPLRRLRSRRRIARGYVTVDTVNACNTTFPQRAGLLRTRRFRDQPERSLGRLLLRQPGRELRPGRDAGAHRGRRGSRPGNYTFYYRYSALNGAPGADQREGLGNVFAVRYLNGGVFDGGTSLLTWRDAKRNITKFNCALGFPAPFPLGQNQVVVFDEEENFETPDGCTISPCPTEEGLIPFPFEAQRRMSAAPLCRPAMTSAGSSST